MGGQEIQQQLTQEQEHSLIYQNLQQIRGEREQEQYHQPQAPVQYHHQQELHQQQLLHQHQQLQQQHPQLQQQLQQNLHHIAQQQQLQHQQEQDQQQLYMHPDPRFSVGAAPLQTFQIWGSPASRQPQSRLSMLLGEQPYRSPPSPIPPPGYSPLHWSPAGVPGGLLAQVFPQIQPQLEQVHRSVAGFAHEKPREQQVLSPPQWQERRRQEQQEQERPQWQEKQVYHGQSQHSCPSQDPQGVQEERYKQEQRHKPPHHGQEDRYLDRVAEQQQRILHPGLQPGHGLQDCGGRGEESHRRQPASGSQEQWRPKLLRREEEQAPPGPRPAPLGEDSPVPGKVVASAGLEIGSWAPEMEEEEVKKEVAPRRVGSGRVLATVHAREMEEGRGAAVEEARTLMERMRLEERQQAERWRRERGYEEEEERSQVVVESGPRPRAKEDKRQGRQEQRGRPGPHAELPGGTPRPSSTLTLDKFLPPEGPRPVKGRGGRRGGGDRGASAPKEEAKVVEGARQPTLGAESQVARRPEAAPCEGRCYWRTQDTHGLQTQAVSCGRPCGLPLQSASCGHPCPRTCHAPPCLPPSAPCPATCPTLRPCGHACSTPCHAPLPCPHLPCQVPIRIPCHCGQRTALLPCLAAFSAPGSQEQEVGRGRRLECREECWALLEAGERQQEQEAIPGLPLHQQGKKKKRKGGKGPLLPGSFRPRPQ